MKRRTLTAAALLGPSTLLPATAQTNSSPITVIVPFPPGDALDATVRAMAAAVQLKVPVITDNKPGASGFIAATAVQRSNNQATFLLGTTAMMAITPFAKKAPYAPNDFIPVARIATISTMVAVPNSFPARTWEEFVALAKKNPGKYSYASPGEGTLLHMNMEALQKAVGIQLVHVPYKGMGPALQDFLGGRIDVYMEPGVISHIKAGTARGLVILSDTRLPDLPDVPTTRELKVSVSQPGWFGIFAPKNQPPGVARRLATALRSATESPELKSKMPPGVQAAFLDGNGLAKLIQTDQALFRKLITDLNIKLD